MSVDGLGYDITHSRTEDSAVAEYFNSGAHEETGMVVIVIELARSHDTTEDMRGQVDQDPGNFVPFGNES